MLQDLHFNSASNPLKSASQISFLYFSLFVSQLRFLRRSVSSDLVRFALNHLSVDEVFLITFLQIKHLQWNEPILLFRSSMKSRTFLKWNFFRFTT